MWFAQYLPAHLIAWALCPQTSLAMRRKATESVDFDSDANASTTGEVTTHNASVTSLREEVGCPGLVWNLTMASQHDDGWKGARLLVTFCDGAMVLNATLTNSSWSQESACLPEKFAVKVNGGPDSNAVQWRLATSGASEISGGSPFEGGLCQEEEAAHKDEPRFLQRLTTMMSEHLDYYMKEFDGVMENMRQQQHHAIIGKGYMTR